MNLSEEFYFGNDLSNELLFLEKTEEKLEKEFSTIVES